MKSIFTSRLFWTGFASFVGGLLGMSKNPIAISAAAIINDPAMQAQAALVVGGIATIVLRAKTTVPVKVLP